MLNMNLDRGAGSLVHKSLTNVVQAGAGRWIAGLGAEMQGVASESRSEGSALADGYEKRKA